ncbi:MAG TPA: ATP-binding protein [Candidatus Polarisedimenticolia bacterium]|nr:ATP-binding protein [Candidatus Polarisedimenticolia bacterium]
MKIGTRLILSLALPLVAIVVLFGYLNERHSRALLHEELARAGRSIARVAQIAMEDYLRDRQIDDARELVDRITGYERVLGFRLLDRDGNLIYQSAELRGTAPFQPGDVGRVLRERAPVEMHRVVGHEPVVAFMLPLFNSQKEPLGVVQVLELESFIEEAARTSRNSTAALTAVMILATGVVIFVVSRHSVGRPIEELVTSLREVGSGDPISRVPVRRRDEFGRLAQEFNSMCERLAEAQRSLLAEQEERRSAEARLRNAERLASLGRLAAGLAHEIGTPLNVIGGRAETLLRRLTGSEVAEKNLRIITAQIERIARIVRGMLDFARAREPRLSPTEVRPVIDKVLEFLEPRFEGGGVRVRPDLPDGLPPVVADADQLHQVFLNLTTNAIDAMPGGGTLSVSARQVRRLHSERAGPERAFLAVAFEDTGGGIAPEHLGRVFDPFFTTKDVGKGTGLGLSVSYGIVREHGGWIDVESEAGRGSRVSVYLPLEEGPPPGRDPAAAFA